MVWYNSLNLQSSFHLPSLTPFNFIGGNVAPQVWVNSVYGGTWWLVQLLGTGVLKDYAGALGKGLLLVLVCVLNWLKKG